MAVSTDYVEQQFREAGGAKPFRNSAVLLPMRISPFFTFAVGCCFHSLPFSTRAATTAAAAAAAAATAAAHLTMQRQDVGFRHLFPLKRSGLS